MKSNSNQLNCFFYTYTFEESSILSKEPFIPGPFPKDSSHPPGEFLRSDSQLARFVSLKSLPATPFITLTAISAGTSAAPEPFCSAPAIFDSSLMLIAVRDRTAFITVFSFKHN